MSVLNNNSLILWGPKDIPDLQGHMKEVLIFIPEDKASLRDAVNFGTFNSYIILNKDN